MKRLFSLSFLILLSLLLRVYFSTHTPPIGDILVHLDWAKTLNQIPLSSSYFHPIWTYTPPSQPPLMMLAFKQSQYLYQSRNTLSLLHNLTKFPPSSFLLWYQEYGQILNLRLWEFLATVFLAISSYQFFKTKFSSRLALIIFILILFNPVSIFLNSIWGQNDTIPNFFAYTSFYLLLGSSPILQLASFPLFITGLLFKPTTLLLLPLFSLLYFLKIKSPKIIIPLIFSIIIVILSFAPFVKPAENIISRIQTIYQLRIQTSAKGDSIASVSAFNFYSLFFNIDQTRSSQPILFFTLKDLSIIIVSSIYLFSFYQLIFNKKTSTQDIFYLIYFSSQGAFLFLTNMLDRYFIPGLTASIILSVIVSTRRPLFLLQNILYFLNLIYAYYYRDHHLINHFFRDHNFLFIRLLSFLNLSTYFLLFQKYFFSKK